jgi:hypothetical protein
MYETVVILVQQGAEPQHCEEHFGSDVEGIESWPNLSYYPGICF